MESIFEHNKKKIATAVFTFVVIISLFFVVKLINEIKEGKYIGTGIAHSSTISVNGEGEVFATPDIANLNFSVSETEDTVKNAQEKVTKKMNDILSFLEEKEIEEKDIKTSGYNIYPRYEFTRPNCFVFPCPEGKRVLIGYEVRHNISLKIRDIDGVGEVLTGIGEMGATNVSGVTFSIDEEEELKEEAREMAIRDARKKAEKLANELGVRLVRVVSFHENNYGVMSARFESFDAKAVGFGGDEMSAPSIPVGENNLTSRVNITYEIK